MNDKGRWVDRMIGHKGKGRGEGEGYQCDSAEAKRRGYRF